MVQAVRPLLTSKDIFEILNKHRGFLNTHSVKNLGLFGSHARNQATETSDIDLLVDFEQPSFDNFMTVVFFLEKIFNTKVDLVTIGSLSPYIQPFVEKEVIWYEIR